MEHDERSRYIRDIELLFGNVASRYPPLRNKPHQQFLFWFMWFNFKWESEQSDQPIPAVLNYLCDNGNDQSIDAFYFDDDDRKVYLIQSKFTSDWRGAGRITYNELKRTADIMRYLEDPSNNSIVYRKANQKCRQLLGQAVLKARDHGYEQRIILVSNRQEPTEDNLDKLQEQTGIDLGEWEFEIFDREKLIRLYAEFLEGHTPPIAPYFVRTVDDRYLTMSVPKYGIEAYVAICPVGVFKELFDKFGRRIFEKNIRSFAGETIVNRAISESLEKDPGLFFFKNSGITILGNEVVPVPKRSSQDPGFRVKDIQIINGQQTTRIIAKEADTSADILVILMAPRVDLRSVYEENVNKKDMAIRIIAARNFQNRIGYSDLKSNEQRQVSIWRELKERGYYYERKHGGWKELDHYGRAIYTLASEKKWAIIRKEQLAAVVLACLFDPQLAYEGADYIFRERYDKVFPKRLPPTDWYLTLFLLWKRYANKVGKTLDNSYPQYHILRMLCESLRVNHANASKLTEALQLDREDPHLARATKILYELSDPVVNKVEEKSHKELGPNDVFGKQSGVLKLMYGAFDSPKFSKKRHLFQEQLAKFRDEMA